MSRQEVIIIAAVAEENRVIGRDMDLPWHLPDDLKRFKRLTLGYPLVMGSRTFFSVLHQFGGPLPKRRNVILSRTLTEIGGYPDLEVYNSIEAALTALADEPIIYIGGGSYIYEAALPFATRLELTLVEGQHEGNIFFPAYEHLLGDPFELTFDEQHPGFRFVTYDRKGAARRP